MVCDRCILAVEKELKRHQINVISIALGKVVVEGNIEPETISELDRNLRGIGFELIDDRKSQLIEQIKTEIISLVHYDKDIEQNVNLSDHIASTVGYDYTYLSTLFSSVAGITIEKYFILQRVERVKELLVYGELTLSEIAWKTGYSSVQHLSNQFKKIIGITPSAYKKMQINNRKALDNI